MSNYFDLHCKTCDVGAGFHWNWGDDELARVVPRLSALAAFALTTGHEFKIELADGYPERSGDLIEFALAHHAHDVGVRSEYGAYHDQCGSNVPCPTCGHPGKCDQPVKHEGDHQRDWSKRPP